jgi:TolB protein
MRSISNTLVLVCALASVAPSLETGSAKYTVAYGSLAPVKLNIFLADRDGKNARPLLAKPDFDYDPSFSADGAWIVFTSQRGGSADLYRVHPNGSGIERLTDDPAFDDQGALSPDGKTLAFVSTRAGKANIWLLDLSSRKLRNLTPDSSGDFRPAWSPDGEWIAFSSDRDTKPFKFAFATAHMTEIYVMRRDGSNVRRLTTSSDAMFGTPSWSPDGSRIISTRIATEEFVKLLVPALHRGDMQLVSIEWQTEAQSVLASGPDEKWFPRWLAMEEIAYVSGGPGGGIERTHGAAGARGEFGNVSWSPDRKLIVFDRDAKPSWPPFEPAVSLDPEFRLVHTGIFPSYSPSGDRFVCNTALAGTNHNAIAVMNADGTKRSILFEDPQKSALAPVWSPRGDLIAFGLGEFFPMSPRQKDKTAQIAIIGADGHGLRILTATDSQAGFPSWSPDGKRLVYRNFRKGLRIIDIATGSIFELTNGPQSDNFPTWSPVGDRIAFTSDRDGNYEIYTIRPDGTDLKRLTHTPGNDAHIAWSKDGQWIAFTSARTGFLDEELLHPYNAQANGEIFVMRADGSDVRRLTENQFEDATPGWVPAKVGSRTPRK